MKEKQQTQTHFNYISIFFIFLWFFFFFFSTSIYARVNEKNKTRQVDEKTFSWHSERSALWIRLNWNSEHGSWRCERCSFMVLATLPTFAVSLTHPLPHMGTRQSLRESTSSRKAKHINLLKIKIKTSFVCAFVVFVLIRNSFLLHRTHTAHS